MDGMTELSVAVRNLTSKVMKAYMDPREARFLQHDLHNGLVLEAVHELLAIFSSEDFAKRLRCTTEKKTQEGVKSDKFVAESCWRLSH